MTREEVMKAIQEEPLLTNKAGWAGFGYYRLDMKDVSYGEALTADKKDIGGLCGVCAVGAVLCAALPKTVLANDVEKLVSLNGADGGYAHYRELTLRKAVVAVQETIQNKDYLGALSCVFETAWATCSHKTARAVTVRFVKEHFPPSIVIDVDGFKPRPKFARRAVK
jgi:hypothetical protein